MPDGPDGPDGPVGSGIGIDVYTDALIQQAKVWEEVSASLGKIAVITADVGYSGNSGFFVHAVENYETVRINVGIWCNEGKTEMQEIAKVLLQAALTYKQAEHHNIQRIQGVH